MSGVVSPHTPHNLVVCEGQTLPVHLVHYYLMKLSLFHVIQFTSLGQETNETGSM
jgi:hypothetical protein